MVTSNASDLAHLARRLSECVRMAGGAAKVARLSDVPVSSLNRYMTGKSEAPAITLGRIARVIGTSVEYLLNGIGEAHVGSVAELQHLSFRATHGAGEGIVRDQNVEDGNAEGFVAIPHLELKASAGQGIAAVGVDHDQPRQIAFRSTWLRSLGIAPQNAEFLAAEGDSMYPTIQNGDLMLVDRGFGQVVNGKIYVLVVNGLVVVKRVSLLAFGGLMLISDNDRYAAETVPRDEVNNLNFQARVAWFGRPI